MKNRFRVVVVSHLLRSDVNRFSARGSWKALQMVLVSFKERCPVLHKNMENRLVLTSLTHVVREDFRA